MYYIIVSHDNYSDRNDPGRFQSPHADVFGRLAPNGLPKGKKAETRPWVVLTNEAQHGEPAESAWSAQGGRGAGGRK